MTQGHPDLHAHLATLADALAGGEAAALNDAAEALQAALRPLAQPPAGLDLAALRQLHAQAAVLRDAVARAQAQNQQGLATLLPQVQAQALYGASGQPQASRSLGVAQA